MNSIYIVRYCMHTCYTYICLYAYQYTHINTYKYMYIYTHINTHTYTCILVEHYALCVEVSPLADMEKIRKRYNVRCYIH